MHKQLISVFCTAVFMMISYYSWSQNALPAQIRIRQTLDGMSDLGGVSQSDLLYGVDILPGRILGDYYLDSKWNKASLLMYGSDKVIEGHYVKYDIEGNALEVKVDKAIKLILVNRIESLVWYDSLTQIPRAFVNAKGYTEKGVPLTGFLEILEDGQFPLAKRTTIWIKQPDYVVAFDVGSKDTKINKRETFYIAKNNELFEIKKKKDLLSYFGDKALAMDEFMKVNDLSIKQERGLRSIMAHYNAQFSDETKE